MSVSAEMNAIFLSSNEIARRRILNDLPVILILTNDTLTLMRYGKVFKQRALELSHYHGVKSVCHFVSGIHLNLIHPSDDLLDKVVEYIMNNKSLFQFGTIKYWCHLVRMCKTKQIEQETIHLAMKHCSEMYQETLHKAVQELKSLVDPNEWNQLLVIVSGPPSPRTGHSAMQYFSRLTGKTNEFYQPSQEDADRKTCRQLYYVENIYTLPEMLNIVAQLLLERKQYDSIVNMTTDILAYDSQTFLQHACHKEARCTPFAKAPL